MSELKVIDLGNIRESIEKGESVYYEYYPKSEADKVIALLKDKANYNEYAYKLKSEELADTCRFYEKELRHQKFKRCLAMASLLHEKRATYRAEYEEWCLKWEKRWQELAEKFKEAK